MISLSMARGESSKIINPEPYKTLHSILAYPCIILAETDTGKEVEKCHFQACGLEIGLEMTLPLSFYKRQNPCK